MGQTMERKMYFSKKRKKNSLHKRNNEFPEIRRLNFMEQLYLNWKLCHHPGV